MGGCLGRSALFLFFLVACRPVSLDLFLSSPTERGSGVWPPPNSKENPDSQKSSPIELLILKKLSFASSFSVSLLIDTYPAAAARRSGRTCRLYTVLMTVLGAWVLVNATALKEKHQVKEQKGRPNKGLSK